MEAPRDQDEDRHLLHQCFHPFACSPLPKLLPPPPPAPRRPPHIPDHPPYPEMVQMALRALAEDGGSTAQVISDYIAASFTGLPSGHSRLLPYYLRKLLAVGDLSMPSPGRFLLRHFPPSRHPPCTRTLNLKSCPKPRRGGRSSALGVRGDALDYPQRRGRPPKASSLPLPLTLPPPSSPRLGSPPKNPPGAPRRRGRPPNNPFAVPASVLRGRGRPRKNPPTESPIIMQTDKAAATGVVLHSKPFVQRKIKRPSSDFPSLASDPMDIDNVAAVGDEDDIKKLPSLLTLSQPSENHTWKPSVLDSERSKSNEPWLPLFKYELEENSIFPSLTQTAADGELVWELPRRPEPEAELWLPYVMPQTQLAANLPQGTSVPARLHEESFVLAKLPEASLPPADQHEESSTSGEVLEEQLVLAVQHGESLPEELQAVDEQHKESVMPTELSEKPLVPAKLNEGLSMSSELTGKSSARAELYEESLPLAELPEIPSVSAGFSENPSISSKLHEEPRMAAKLFEKRSAITELYEQPSMLAEQHEKTLMSAKTDEDSAQTTELFAKSSILLELNEESLMSDKLHDESVSSDKLKDEPSLLAEMQEKTESETESLSVSVPNCVKPEEASNVARQKQYQFNLKSSLAAPLDDAEVFHHEERQYESQGEEKSSVAPQNAPEEQFSSTATTPASQEIQRDEVCSKRRSQAKRRKLWFEN